MRKSIFTGVRPSGAGIKIDSFFAELALIIPVFAISCCAVLRMLAVSSERAGDEMYKSLSVTLAQSYCELYSECGSMEKAAAEIFGSDIPDELLSSSRCAVPLDKNGTYSPSSENFAAVITETVEEMTTDGIAYGQLCTSDIRISYEGEEFSCSAVCYIPYKTVIYIGGEDGNE